MVSTQSTKIARIAETAKISKVGRIAKIAKIATVEMRSKEWRGVKKAMQDTRATFESVGLRKPRMRSTRASHEFQLTFN